MEMELRLILDNPDIRDSVHIVRSENKGPNNDKISMSFDETQAFIKCNSVDDWID